VGASRNGGRLLATAACGEETEKKKRTATKAPLLGPHKKPLRRGRNSTLWDPYWGKLAAPGRRNVMGQGKVVLDPVLVRKEPYCGLVQPEVPKDVISTAIEKKNFFAKPQLRGA